MPTPAITYSEDWKRINALPIREVTRSWGEQLSKELTPLLRRPDAADTEAELKWIQAVALHEIYEGRGAYLGLPVGSGKTLITFLAPYILGCKNAVLILPSSLRDKTNREFHKYSQTWEAPTPLPHLLGIKTLYQEENLHLLERMCDPTPIDLVMVDEVDLMRRTESSATKRVDRFKTNSIPEGDEPLNDVEEWCKARGVPYVCATGTGTRFSILDFAHMLNWCREDGSPVPLDQSELARWAEALDEKRNIKQRRKQRPGALLELIDAPEAPGETDLEQARRLFMLRLRSTPGVIITDGNDCDQPMTIDLVCAPEDEKINDAFEVFATEWMLPNGQEIIDGLSYWRGDNDLGCGGYGVWKDPQPPDEWRQARRAYGALINKVVEQTAWSPNPKDTAKAVAKAFPDHPVVVRWRKLKPLYTPVPEHRWISSSVVNYAAQWAKRHRRGSLIWTKSLAVGEAVAHAAGLRFFSEGGLSADGANIETVDDSVAVVSINSNSRGRNLQDRFHTGLVLGCPQSGEQCEQLFGRKHRYGQKNPVHWEILITSGLSRYAFGMAQREARFVLKTQKQRHKILRAKVSDCSYPSDAIRWAQRDHG